jgi:hypothetical protein
MLLIWIYAKNIAGMDALLDMLEEALRDGTVSVQSAAAWALANVADALVKAPDQSTGLCSRVVAGADPAPPHPTLFCMLSD